MKTTTVTWSRCYGRDGSDITTALPNSEAMAAQAENVTFNDDGLPSKRHGSDAVDLQVSGSITGAYKLGRYYYPLFSTSDLLFGTDRSATTKIFWARMNGAGGNSFTLVDACSGPTTACFAQFNSKMFVAYDSPVDRLHVAGILEIASTSTLQRAGLAVSGAATVANTGAGTYPATARYYKVALTSAVRNRRSELSAAVSFTPSGTGTAARITRPASLPGEGEDNWLIYASPDNTIYYYVATVAIGTSTYDDSTLVSAYANGPAAPPVGTYALWPSPKFILAAGDRLMGFGSWEGSHDGQVMFSPVLGTTAYDDDERVSDVETGADANVGYISVGIGQGYDDTGLAGPVNDCYLVGQSRGIYLLRPTGNAIAPFQRFTLSSSVGCIFGTMFNGQDELGNPCVYWLDETAGPYRYGIRGLEWLGYDVRDIWQTYNRFGGVSHGLFSNEDTSARFWIPTGSSATAPTTILKFNARLGKQTGPTGVRFGWSVDTGDSAAAFGATLARAASYSSGSGTGRFLPVLGLATKVVVADVAAATDDDGTAFAAFVQSKAVGLAPVNKQKGTVTGQYWIQAEAADGVLIRQTISRNYGQSSVSADVSISPTGDESRVLQRYEGAGMADAFTVQVMLGDPYAVSNAWTLDQHVMEVETSSQDKGNGQ